MKRLTLFLLMVALISFLPCSSIAETLSLSTYYPAPFGVYNQLRLVPGVAPACNDNNDGLMWVDSTTFEIMMCRGSKAITTVGAWTQNTNTPPNIWSTDPTANVGIGLTEPKARLHIKGTGNENIFMAEVSGGKETISYDSSGILKLVGGGIWADEFWRKSDISLKENITPVLFRYLKWSCRAGSLNGLIILQIQGGLNALLPKLFFHPVTASKYRL